MKNNMKGVELLETRAFDLSECRYETREDGTSTVVGHAAVFNKLSRDLGGFVEKIEVGAFDDVLSDDVRALINHDANLILGRTEAGTLELKADNEGLSYKINMPDTSYARDLAVSLERGDISQSSFGFVIEEDSWDVLDDGMVIRTIKKVKRLYDVSPVTYPAYPDTDAAKRSLEQYRSNKESVEAEKAKALKEEKDLHKRSLRKMRLAIIKKQS